LFGDLEPDRSARLPLLNSSALARVSVGSYVLHAEPYEVAGSQLAVYSEIEESQVPKPTVKLKACPDCPDMLWLKRWLCADKLAFVPRALQRTF
jgi:hypothetical protein